MTPEEAFTVLRPRIDAVEPSLVSAPNRKATEDRVLEGHRLYAIAMRDRDPFMEISRAGHFNMDDLDLLQTAALALDYAESEWARENQQARSESYLKKLERGFELRAIILRDLEYIASRFEPPGLSRTLPELRRGSSQQNMLQDLASCALLAEHHADLLEKIGFDLSLGEEAATLAVDIGRSLSADKTLMARAKSARDRATTLFEKMYSEVLRTGQFIFRNHATRLADYRDHTL